MAAGDRELNCPEIQERLVRGLGVRESTVVYNVSPELQAVVLVKDLTSPESDDSSSFLHWVGQLYVDTPAANFGAFHVSNPETSQMDIQLNQVHVCSSGNASILVTAGGVSPLANLATAGNLNFTDLSIPGNPAAILSWGPSLGLPLAGQVFSAFRVPAQSFSQYNVPLRLRPGSGVRFISEALFAPYRITVYGNQRVHRA